MLGSHLQEPFPLEPTRDYARGELIAMLDMADGGEAAGEKLLVIDPLLSGVLGLIADSALLQEHGVTKSTHLTPNPIRFPHNVIVYLVRGTVANAKTIAEHIRHQVSRKLNNDYHICMVPRHTPMVQRVLEEEGVWLDSVTVGEVDLGLVPIEDDLVSMEMGNLYRDCEVLGDRSGLFYVAKSLMRLQLIYGVIPLVRGKGDHAKQVAEMLEMLRQEMGEEAEGDEARAPMIDELILVDRATDMVSPMLTPRTYEGLIDEHYLFENGVAAIPASVVLTAQGKHASREDRDLRVKVPMTGVNDEMFKRLRDLGLPSCGKALNDRAVELTRMTHDEGGEDDEKRLRLHESLAGELREVTNDLNYLRRIEVESMILQGGVLVEGALECAEEMMYRHDPFHQTIRMFCLISIVFDGVKRHAHYSAELCNCYGPETMVALKTLEKCGLWKSKDDDPSGIGAAAIAVAQAALRGGQAAPPPPIGAQWEAAKACLSLVVRDVSLGDPTDVAYTFGGYAPISVRIAEKALRTPHDRWMSLEEPLKSIPGSMFALTQVAFPPNADQVYKTVLVFYVGGMTPAETSGVRFAGVCYNGDLPHGGVPVKLLIGASKKSGGGRLIESLCGMPANRVRQQGAKAI